MKSFRSWTKCRTLKKWDLVSLHYDYCPDPDDGHATVAGKAIMDFYWLTYEVITGTCWYDFIDKLYDKDGERVVKATYGSNFLNAIDNKEWTIEITANRWIEILSQGNSVHVAEWWQSDLTADILRRIKSKNGNLNLKKVNVIQHSCGNNKSYNELNTKAVNLQYVKNTGNYICIPNGNIWWNWSPQLANIHSPSFENTAKASYLWSAWNVAFDYLNPSCATQVYRCKLDFSDTVEILKITNDLALKNVNDFATKFLSRTTPYPANIESSSLPSDSSTSSSSSGWASSSSSARNADCSAATLWALEDCLNQWSNKTIELTSNITCSGWDCCKNWWAIFNLNGKSNVTIYWNGNTFLRTDNQRSCELVSIQNSNNIRFENIVLDDDSRVVWCRVTDNCPRMVHIKSSNNTTFERVEIKNWKWYTLYWDDLDGFTFNNSRFINAWVLWLYIWEAARKSTNIKITNSYFWHNSTNAVALRWVTGTNLNTNIISGNTFEDNHHIWQFEVAPQFWTGFTGGGQVYLMDLDNLTFRDNIIENWNCLLCKPTGRSVTWLELWDPRVANSVQNVLIENNTIRNNTWWTIHSNDWVTVRDDVVIRNNKLQWGIWISVGDASQSNNWANAAGAN